MLTQLPINQIELNQVRNYKKMQVRQPEPEVALDLKCVWKFALEWGENFAKVTQNNQI